MFKTILKRFVPKRTMEWMVRVEARCAAAWASAAHRRLRQVQWGLPPAPEHFDHHIDLYHQWLESRNPQWVERGVFGGLALQGGDVLEIACGDGFNARNFYSLRSRRVLACDFDPMAIATARRKNTAANVEFVLADVRTAMPEGVFQNVVWDAAIEHFTLDEMAGILRNIRARLSPEGILSGQCTVERLEETIHHEYEFKGMDDLLPILKPHFANVTVFETIYPSRHNLYFWASDAALPFTPGWAHAVTASAAVPAGTS